MMSLRFLPRVAKNGFRSYWTLRPSKFPPIDPDVEDNVPVFEDTYFPPSDDPDRYIRQPVTSVHCIDLEKQQISMLDSVAVNPSGKIIHGIYGDLGETASAIPLEYLALLRPAAEGAAAIRTVMEKSKNKGKGTILIYGSSQPTGYAASLLASSSGHGVVAVVGGEHTGNTLFMESMKGLISEPGTAVSEEYALVKKLFSDLVDSISTGDEQCAHFTPEQFLSEFVTNLLAYAEMYPNTKPAAVSDEHLDFKYMLKDRKNFEENMAAYLEQLPSGSPPMDKAKLDAFFTTEQYQIFRDKFWVQTTDLISDGGFDPFSPPHIVKDLCEIPGVRVKPEFPTVGPRFPYSFDTLDQYYPDGTKQKAAGPILGAVIVATPELKFAAEKIAAEKTLRLKAEALQFLTHSQRGAFSAACSVAAKARNAGAPIVVVGGSLPELETVKINDQDVKEALSAMDIDKEGQSRLNYFVQVYRASDFPFYESYAIHRATEVLAGPRQIVVTK